MKNTVRPKIKKKTKSMDKVAVIIVSYNGEKYLPALLASLKRFQPLKCQADVFIIDNSSIDNSISFVRENFPEVKLVLNQENAGFAAGNNIGLKMAIGQGYDYAMLLNQDTQITAGCLDKLVDAIKNNKQAAAVQPKILLYPKKHLINSVGCAIHYLGFGYAKGHLAPELDNDTEIREVDYCSGAACLLKASALKSAGLLDSRLFMYHEDLDLGWRFKLLGFKNILEPRSVVYHEYEFSRSIKKFYYMERNRWLVMFKNYKSGTLFLILPALVIMELGLLLFSFGSGWLPEKLKVYWYFFKPNNWLEILRQRNIVQKQRVLSDRQAVWNFSGKILSQEINNPIINYLANPIFNAYWQIIKRIIFW